MKKNYHDIQFTSQGLLLKGLLHMPPAANPPLVVGSHGLEGSKESAKQQVLSNRLVENGIAFFRFDHRGCGQSEGDFIKETSLEKRTHDLVSAVEQILDLGITRRDVAVFGSSMGGATCINAWDKLLKMKLNLCGSVLCSAPVKSRTIENIPTDSNPNRPALPLSFFKKNLLFNLSDKTKNLYNILIFHGDADEVVPFSNAHIIYDHAREPKRLILHKNGDHQMTCRKDQVQFETEAVQWYLRCFSMPGKVSS